MLTVGSLFLGKAIDLDYQGQGIVKHEGYVVFVRGLIDGEEAKIKITRVKKNFGQGEVVELLKSSRDRVDDENSRFGSCDLIHISKSKQLKWQRRITQETFKKIMKEDFEVHETITDGNDKYYRNKSVFQVLDSMHLTLGLYDQNSKELLPVDHFVLADQKTNELLSHLATKRCVINPKVFKYMAFRTNLKHEILVTLVATKELFLGRDQLVDRIKEIKGVVGITLNINNQSNRILGDESITIYGENLITEPLNDIDMLINDQSFFQINIPVISKAYEIINSEIEDGKEIIDAYSGIGSIGFSLAKKAKKVVMIESNQSSVEMAKRIKDKYQFEHVEIIDERAEIMIKHLTADYLIVDPPRNGLMPEFVQSILEQSYEKIFYLSCDAKTLVRDIALLSSKYEIKEIYPIRMFFHTSSLETLVILKKI